MILDWYLIDHLRCRTRCAMVTNDNQRTNTLTCARRKRKKKSQTFREKHVEKTESDTRVTVLRDRGQRRTNLETMDASCCHQGAVHLPLGGKGRTLCERWSWSTVRKPPKLPPDNSSCLTAAAQKVTTRWSHASIKSPGYAECRRHWRTWATNSVPSSVEKRQRRKGVKGKIEHHPSYMFRRLLFKHNHGSKVSEVLIRHNWCHTSLTEQQTRNRNRSMEQVERKGENSSIPREERFWSDTRLDEDVEEKEKHVWAWRTSKTQKRNSTGGETWKEHQIRAQDTLHDESTEWCQIVIILQHVMTRRAWSPKSSTASSSETVRKTIQRGSTRDQIESPRSNWRARWHAHANHWGREGRGQHVPSLPTWTRQNKRKALTASTSSDDCYATVLEVILQFMSSAAVPRTHPMSFCGGRPTQRS